MTKDQPLAVHVHGKAPLELEEYITASGARLTSDIADAEFLVWNSLSAEGLTELLHPGIRWVQLPSAGINKWIDGGVIDAERSWASAAGAYSDVVADHAVALLLSAIHRVPEHANARSWKRLEFRPLNERRVVITGLGGIGRAIAQRLRALGVAEVRGVVRNDRVDGSVDRVTTLSDPTWHVSVDDIINVLPSTPETRGVINAEVLASLPGDGSLINVGRGGAIVDDDVLAALSNDELGGVFLDVTDPEPLPDSRPYWRDERVVVTSHSANPSRVATRTFIQRVLENISRAADDEPLLGLIDVESGY